MSRSYEVNIEVEKIRDGEAEAIEEAIENYGEELSFNNHGTTLFAYGETSLCGGASEDDRSRELAKVIWDVTKRPVNITFSWYCLEREPDETCYMTEDDFAEMFPALEQLAMAADGEEESD